MALLLKVTLIEAYIVPTGSMEKTIMIGDFLIGNRFVYGMRTPDWIGIPYTDIGFDIPYFRFPKFREPKQGDIIIFKYPRDPHLKNVKRCIAEPGDTLHIFSAVDIEVEAFIIMGGPADASLSVRQLSFQQSPYSISDSVVVTIYNVGTGYMNFI